MAYQQGKTDAYEEIFAWLTQQSLAGQQDAPSVPKNVSIQKFKQHMTEKMQLAQKSIDEGEFQMP